MGRPVTPTGIRVVALVCVVLTVGLSQAPAAADVLGDLLSELQIIPMLDQVPPPFTLESLDGPQVSLAALRGRAVFLYFWEST